MKKITVYLSFIFLFCSVLTFGQKNYVDGYVILNNHDTLYGKIKDRKIGGYPKLYPKIKFKSQDGKTKSYSPEHILGYKSGTSVFESLWFKDVGPLINPEGISQTGVGEKQFFKLVVKGYLSLYYLEYVNADGNWDYTPYFKRENESTMVFVRYGLLGLNKKQLIAYFKDCPTLQTKIKTKAFTNPYEIIVFYNYWYSKQQLK